jgi:hypothetical protein
VLNAALILIDWYLNRKGELRCVRAFVHVDWGVKCFARSQSAVSRHC